jgi:hypothetical protein
MRIRGTVARALLAGTLAAESLGACVGPPTPESERAVRDLWGEYLASKQGRFFANAATPSPRWSAAEQRRWPLYDLAGVFLPDHAVPEVMSVEPVNAEVDSAYRIVTRFWPEGSAPRDSATVPVLTMTTYARREGRRWALDVPAPPRIEYYVTESVDQAMEISGAVVPQRFGPNGGFARPVNAQVFSGIPALGENYRHELVHVLLLPIIRDASSSLLASEGVPTWFGGTAGRDFEGSVRHLDSLLRDEPTLDLRRIVYDMRVSSEIRNATGAVLAQMVHEAGGMDAVRTYLRTPAHAVQDTLAQLLARPWEVVVADWRQRVADIAGRALDGDASRPLNHEQRERAG